MELSVEATGKCLAACPRPTGALRGKAAACEAA